MTGSPPHTLEKEALGAAIGRLASGVYIVTAETPSMKVGMLASWIVQAGFEPPTLTLALTKDRELYKAIEETGKFTVNVIAKSHHHLMKAFSHYRPDQFTDIDATPSTFGPVLGDAIAYLHCQKLNTMDAPDHVIVLAEITDGAMQHPDVEPFVHLRKNGFSY